METGFTLDEVRAAFQRVEDQVAAQGADAECLWAIHYAIEDGLGVLAGELTPEDDAPDEDGLRLAALEARTVGEFDAAVLRLLPGLDDRQRVERERIDIDLFWRPSPASNEAMLGALEVFLQKFFGAMSRGAARSEAEMFALIEARRVYQRR